MEIADLLRLYDTEFRARPRVLPGRRLEQVDGVLLITGLSNFVCHWAFPEDDAASVISRMADRFRDGAGLTWDVYAHDRPAHLGRPLSAHGFVEEHRSTLMMLDLAAGAPAMPAGIEVRRVADRAALGDFVRVSAEAFGASADWQFDAFADRLDGDEDLLFNAYLDGEAAGSSRIEMTRGSKFAGLFGGAVSPRFQGAGFIARWSPPGPGRRKRAASAISAPALWRPAARSWSASVSHRSPPSPDGGSRPGARLDARTGAQA